MKSFAAALAALAVRRPAVLAALALFLAAASLGLLRSKQSFDSEILNLLPAGTPSVEGLRLFNSRFAQARELAFLVEDDGDGTATEEFAAALREQPWVLRVLDAAPTESAEGRATLPALAAPLLLSSEPHVFDEALARLKPDAVSARLDRLSAAMAAGSPLARFELAYDPLGVLTPLAAELAERMALEETFAVTAGNVRILPVITTQADISAEACSALMNDVHRFVASFTASPAGKDVRIGVTGRSAYVDEISRSMRRDITATTAVSILAVTVLFWFAFRSFVPLLGSVLILGFTCLLSLAAGSLLFDKLNVIAMGFCSILVGLGDDFSLLLYQRYVLARSEGMDREGAIAASTRHAAPGIFWVGLTTSLGFLALIFSGSAGFGQLGILIAVGVALGALGMVLFMPLFERQPARQEARDPIASVCLRLLKPGVAVFMAVVLFAGLLIAVAPWRPLGFDTSPRSLEPRNIPAAKTLAGIMAAFPDVAEPVMVVVPAPVVATEANRVEETLTELREQGLVASFASPLPLLPRPVARERNTIALAALDRAALDRVLADSARRNNLRDEALAPARDFLDALKGGHSLSDTLPASSPWWFAVDRMVSGEGDAIFYVRPARETAAARENIERAIRARAPNVYVTGWTQMLNDLVPWASRELVTFGSAVIVIILGVLIFTYRNLRLLLLHALCLVLAMSATAALLKLSGQAINLLNVLAFPLILAVGVDYGVHLVLASRESGDPTRRVAAVMKPILISGLTTIAGFGALVLADNPALSGLGFVCATGVACCLAASLGLLAPVLVRFPQMPAGAAAKRR